MFDERVASELGAAYRALNNGTSFRMPPQTGEIADLSTRVRQQLNAARALLVQNKSDEGARLVLQAALLIVTPAP
jgi:hypothetical protein